MPVAQSKEAVQSPPAPRSFRELPPQALLHPQLSIAAHRTAYELQAQQRVVYDQKPVDPDTITQTFAGWVEELPAEDSLKAVLQTASVRAATSQLTIQLVSNTQIRLLDKCRERLLQELRQRLNCQHFQLYTELVLAELAPAVDPWQAVLREFPTVEMLIHALELERID